LKKRKSKTGFTGAVKNLTAYPLKKEESKRILDEVRESIHSIFLGPGKLSFDILKKSIIGREVFVSSKKDRCIIDVYRRKQKIDSAFDKWTEEQLKDRKKNFFIKLPDDDSFEGHLSEMLDTEKLLFVKITKDIQKGIDGVLLNEDIWLVLDESRHSAKGEKKTVSVPWAGKMHYPESEYLRDYFGELQQKIRKEMRDKGSVALGPWDIMFFVLAADICPDDILRRGIYPVITKEQESKGKYSIGDAKIRNNLRESCDGIIKNIQPNSKWEYLCYQRAKMVLASLNILEKKYNNITGNIVEKLKPFIPQPKERIISTSMFLRGEQTSGCFSRFYYLDPREINIAEKKRGSWYSDTYLANWLWELVCLPENIRVFCIGKEPILGLVILNEDKIPQTGNRKEILDNLHTMVQSYSEGIRNLLVETRLKKLTEAVNKQNIYLIEKDLFSLSLLFGGYNSEVILADGIKKVKDDILFKLPDREFIIKGAKGLRKNYLNALLDVISQQQKLIEAAKKSSLLIQDLPHNILKHALQSMTEAYCSNTEEGIENGNFLRAFLQHIGIFIEILGSNSKNTGGFDLKEHVDKLTRSGLFSTLIDIEDPSGDAQFYRENLEKYKNFFKIQRENGKDFKLKQSSLGGFYSIWENLLANAFNKGISPIIKETYLACNDENRDIEIEKLFNKPWIYIKMEDLGNEVKFCFWDVGRGFDEATKRKIESWNKGERFEGKKGYGFWIINRATEIMRGTFEFKSIKKKNPPDGRYWLKFIFTLPKNCMNNKGINK